MKKAILSILVMILLSNTILKAQVGINTSNLQGVFTVDGTKDDPDTGSPSAAQQANNVSVTSTGSLGIGNTAPVAKLDIVGTNFGMKMASGSGSWDNIWFNLTSSIPSINASGAENGLQFNVGANATGTYGDGQTLTTVATITSVGNMGVGITAPTNRLDVNGTARVRSISPVAVNTTVNTAYTDANGVFVKTSAGQTFGNIVTNTTGSIASGGTGTLITGLPDGGVYKAIVMTGDGCAYIAIAEFMVTTYSSNSVFALKGLDGLLGASNTKAPLFTETNKNTTGVTWTGKPACYDGSNSTSSNFTLTMPNAFTINITNNGNIARFYSISFTRYN